MKKYIVLPGCTHAREKETMEEPKYPDLSIPDPFNFLEEAWLAELAVHEKHLASLPVLPLSGFTGLKENDVLEVGVNCEILEGCAAVGGPDFLSPIPAQQEKKMIKSTRDILKENISCDCRDVYFERGMPDPHCTFCDRGSEIEAMMQEYANQFTPVQDGVEAVDWEQAFDDAQSMHRVEFVNYYKEKK